MNFVVEKHENHRNLLCKLVINYEPVIILLVIKNLHIHKTCSLSEAKRTFYVFKNSSGGIYNFQINIDSVRNTLFW